MLQAFGTMKIKSIAVSVNIRVIRVIRVICVRF